ncbi:uncharacterized protein LAESUDRAFT_39812 [Laetiporus sulphureus 93-53]|uniref:Uncharacterized protein n=1 Tax=Laetiporus sulphureus 93-53 TaxID=1314785 RepID=A0A165IN77_9APHY|nr:uncharacterized protein LAESUDRAFT_39812 [Laetiporus sulphureus 93-53]KZT13313.1 hypothetical protein LAESUDRAFT_39812 [Laetiporus sulphureus 93-53]
MDVGGCRTTHARYEASERTVVRRPSAEDLREHCGGTESDMAKGRGSWTTGTQGESEASDGDENSEPLLVVERSPRTHARTEHPTRKGRRGAAQSAPGRARRRGDKLRCTGRMHQTFHRRASSGHRRRLVRARLGRENLRARAWHSTEATTPGVAIPTRHKVAGVPGRSREWKGAPEGWRENRASRPIRQAVSAALANRRTRAPQSGCPATASVPHAYLLPSAFMAPHPRPALLLPQPRHRLYLPPRRRRRRRPLPVPLHAPRVLHLV